MKFVNDLTQRGVTLKLYSEEFYDNGSICACTNPVGGYFISFFTYPTQQKKYGKCVKMLE